MMSEVHRHGKTKTKYIMKEPHSVVAGDWVLVQGKWLEVVRVLRRNCHPFQLVEFYFAEFPKFPLRFAMEGYQIRVAYTGTVESIVDD